MNEFSFSQLKDSELSVTQGGGATKQGKEVQRASSGLPD